MTDAGFKEYMRKRALDRKAKIKAVREKERMHRKEVEKSFKELVSVLNNFRNYTFIVIKNTKSKPITIYSDTSYAVVKELVESLEAYYDTTGELIYTLYRTYK